MREKVKIRGRKEDESAKLKAQDAAQKSAGKSAKLGKNTYKLLFILEHVGWIWPCPLANMAPAVRRGSE